MDRQNIASFVSSSKAADIRAKLADIVPDLHMTSTDYSTAVAVLFAGYVSLQVPSNMLASKIAYPGICKWCASEADFRYLFDVRDLGSDLGSHW